MKNTKRRTEDELPIVAVLREEQRVRSVIDPPTKKPVRWYWSALALVGVIGAAVAAIGSNIGMIIVVGGLGLLFLALLVRGFTYDLRDRGLGLRPVRRAIYLSAFAVFILTVLASLSYGLIPASAWGGMLIRDEFGGQQPDIVLFLRFATIPLAALALGIMLLAGPKEETK